jgi:hypothetical protein
MYNVYTWVAALLIITFLEENPGFIYNPKKCIKCLIELMLLKLDSLWLKVELTWNRAYHYAIYGIDIKEVIEKNGEKYFGW